MLVDLDERQQRIFDALGARNAHLAGMYILALRELATDPIEGCENARISIICHCCREIQNGLPYAFDAEVVERPDPNSAALLERLPTVITRANANLESEDGDAVVAVPSALVAHIRDLADTRTREDGRSSTNFAVLLTGDPEADVLAWPLWRDTSKYFVGWAHIDRRHREGRALPTNDDLQARIKIIEDVIDQAVSEFFPNLNKLKGLLAAANAGSPTEAPS